MPSSSLAFVRITQTEHQVFVQTGYHAFITVDTHQLSVCMTTKVDWLLWLAVQI